MSTTSFLLLFVSHFIRLFDPNEAVYLPTTAKRMIAKILHMDRELVKDADSKVQSFHHISLMYSKSPAFQMGKQISAIDNLLKKSLELRDKAETLGMGMSNVNRLKIVIDIQKQAMHTDQMLRVIEHSEWLASDRSHRGAMLQSSLRKTKMDNISSDEILRLEKQEDRKRLRAQMQKIRNIKNAPAIKVQKYPDDGFDTD